MGVSVRSVLREKGTPFHEQGLDDASLTDDWLLDAMMAHPILMNWPIVVSPLGVKLCHSSEAMLDLLPNQQQAAFTREDREGVIEAGGRCHPRQSKAMSETIEDGPAVKAPSMGTFEHYLTLWAALYHRRHCARPHSLLLGGLGLRTSFRVRSSSAIRRASIASFSRGNFSVASSISRLDPRHERSCKEGEQLAPRQSVAEQNLARRIGPCTWKTCSAYRTRS
jgi:hypothetical protein